MSREQGGEASTSTSQKNVTAKHMSQEPVKAFGLPLVSGLGTEVKERSMLSPSDSYYLKSG